MRWRERNSWRLLYEVTNPAIADPASKQRGFHQAIQGRVSAFVQLNLGPAGGFITFSIRNIRLVTERSAAAELHTTQTVVHRPSYLPFTFLRFLFLPSCLNILPPRNISAEDDGPGRLGHLKGRD